MAHNSKKNKGSILKRLKALSKPYKEKTDKFQSRRTVLRNQFGLKPEQEREVDFGIIIPADRTLQKYCDIMNSDQELNDLRTRIDMIILEGCVDIFKELKSLDTYMPGYDLEAFIVSPDENIQEIKDLMQGFGGYKHIHSIGEKIALEVPARKFLPKNRQLKSSIKFWLKTVKEFSMWD